MRPLNMDKLDRYRDIIEQVLAKHVFNSDRYPHLRDRTIFDRRSDNYLVLREGWDQSDHTLINQSHSPPLMRVVIAPTNSPGSIGFDR